MDILHHCNSLLMYHASGIFRYTPATDACCIISNKTPYLGLGWLDPHHWWPYYSCFRFVGRQYWLQRLATTIHFGTASHLSSNDCNVHRLGMVHGEQNAAGATNAAIHLEEYKVFYIYGGYDILLGYLR